jgi:hypothetical protein
MTITPDQAQNLLADATPGPWMLNPQGCILVDDGTNDPPGPHGFIGTMWKAGDPDNEGNGHLMAAAPDLAQTIAGMRTEWRRETRIVGDEEWASMEWRSTRWDAEADQVWWFTPKDAIHEYRLVRRFVTAPEVVEP